jgi:putative transposase
MNKNTINKSFKVRFYPNQQQKILLNKMFGCSRFVYNHYLKLKRDTYKEQGITLTNNQLSADLTILKKQEDFNWLSDVPSTCLRQSLLDLNSAYSNFFRDLKKPKGSNKAGLPTFKSKYNKKSVRMQDIVLKDGVLKLPKLGAVKIKVSHEFPGIPKMATVSLDATGKYHISFSVECQVDLFPATNNIIGIDAGLKVFLYDSNGNSVENPRFLKKKLKALKRSQRALSRSKKESNRREKKRKAVALIYQKVSNSRSDFLHKLSYKIVKSNDVIIVEDLKIKNLLKNKRLSRSIADASWSDFFRLLEYKSKWYGRTFLKVNPNYTSRDCNVCGHRHETPMSLHIREWTCSSCNTFHDRDLNAAKNILARGLSDLGIPNKYPGELGN